MSDLRYKVRGNSPQGKPRVYFCCHKEDFPKYFEKLSEEILNIQPCAIWYRDDFSRFDDALENDLKQMQLFVIPVTARFLTTDNQALKHEFPVALHHHIPILPLMQEPGLADLFNLTCGNLHFLDPHQTDATAIRYEEKLKKYLESVLIGSELTEKIRAAFDAYIFLSYRKKDRKYAQELMGLIHKNDFCRDIAIWYDEFLVPGESFSDSIQEAIHKSDLFVLAVTPNLVNEPNYIVTTEYPMAKEEQKTIFPVELIRTNKKQLTRKFDGIPSPTNAHDDELFSKSLLENIKNIALSEKDSSPEHSFFIGLAYLNGIDVEVNRQRAVDLITYAAENQVPEAMKKLFTMYRDGEGVTLDYKRSLYWAEKHYDSCVKNFGQIHTDTLHALIDLASACGAAGDYQKQEYLCDRVYRYSKALLGADHPDTIHALSNHAVALAMCYDEREKDSPFAYREQALYCSEDAYTQYRDTLGEEHLSTIQALSNYGVALSKWKRHQNKTFACFEKVYQLRKKLLGEEHPETIAAMINLASAYGNYSDHKTRLEMLEKVYALHEKLFGEEHPVTITTLFHLADCHFKMEHFIEGIEFNVKVCELRRKILGDDHIETKHAYENIRSMFHWLQYFHTDMDAHAAAYIAMCRLQDDTHHDLAKALEWLAIAYSQQGESKEKEFTQKVHTLKKEALRQKRKKKIMKWWRRMLHGFHPIRLSI